MSDITYEQFFSTLSVDSRLEILQLLKQKGAQSVSEIVKGTGQEQSAVSHNLKKLLSCECVHVEARGKSRYYSLNSDTILPLLDLADKHIQKYCKTNCQHCSNNQTTDVSRDS